MTYKEIYINYFGFCKTEYIPCEYCKSQSVDVHHLLFKSHGGKNEIDNLIALCRSCHNLAHEQPMFNEHLKEIHGNNTKRIAKD